MLDKRLEATYVEQSSLHLEEHLKQLNTLYKNMSSQMYSSSVISNLFKNMSAFGTLAGTPQNNPYYPKESYDEFIAKMIEKKEDENREGFRFEIIRETGGIKPLPHFENLLHTFAMQYKIKVQANIETVCLLSKETLIFCGLWDIKEQKWMCVL